MRLSLNFNPKKKILPIFYLTYSSKVLFYARTAHLCVSFLGSQEIIIDMDREGASMSTDSEVDQHHGIGPENAKRYGVAMRDAFKADTLNTARLPKSALTWNLHEVGAENLCHSRKLKKYECSSTARHQPLGSLDSNI
jgi:hypothetical protein